MVIIIIGRIIGSGHGSWLWDSSSCCVLVYQISPWWKCLLSK